MKRSVTLSLMTLAASLALVASPLAMAHDNAPCTTGQCATDGQHHWHKHCHHCHKHCHKKGNWNHSRRHPHVNVETGSLETPQHHHDWQQNGAMDNQ